MGDIEPDISGLRELEAEDIKNDDPRLRPSHVSMEQYLEMEMAAQTDKLTGLLNDRRFAMDLGNILRTGERNFALFFIDVNNLKEFNDEDKTHALGDYIIVRIADLLREYADVHTDQKYRFGKGDEFVLIAMNVTSNDDMKKIGRRLVSAFSGERDSKNKALPSACIGGIWVDEKATDDDVKGAIFGADRAMYEAKQRANEAVMKHSGRKPSRFCCL